MAKKLQPYEKSSKLSLWEIIFNNFTGGFFWALGATVGLSIFFTLLTLLAKNVNLVPVVGTFVSNVINFILATNPHLNK
jgi:hypothetical protein